MTISVNKVGNNIYQYSNVNRHDVSMNGATLPCKKDESNDGKFSVNQAMKNFGKGLVSPITGMFSSVGNFVAGAATIAGATALVVATGGAAAPILVAAGVAMGGYQAAKGVYKIATAKNGDEAEKAFYDIGGATTAIGLSVMGAKTSLKQVGIDTKGMDTYSATTRCFKDTKLFFNESKELFKSGSFVSNLYNWAKPYLYTSRIRDLSKMFAKEGSKSFKQDFKEVRNMLPDEFRGDLLGRPKSRTSILDKLIDRGVFGKKIKKISQDKKLTKEQKALEIENQLKKKEKFAKDDEYAKQLVDDLVGTRLVVKDPVPENIDRIAQSMADAIRNDKIVITEIKNYRGPKNENGFYFKDHHINEIVSAVESKGQRIKFLEDKSRIKDTGYCAVQVKIKHKSGNYGELQIRGSHVDEVSNWEHIPYDLRKDKDIFKGNIELAKMFQPVKKAIKNLSTEQYKEYENYIANMYQHARDKEIGIIYEPLELPQGFDQILSAKELTNLYKKSQSVKINYDRKPLVLPQAGFSSSILKGDLD